MQRCSLSFLGACADSGQSDPQEGKRPVRHRHAPRGMTARVALGSGLAWVLGASPVSADAPLRTDNADVPERGNCKVESSGVNPEISPMAAALAPISRANKISGLPSAIW